jgi:hypothetical protein
LSSVMGSFENEDEYETLAEWQWQEKTEMLGENPVPVSLSCTSNPTRTSTGS